ncbi:MAG: hypothetical protein FWD12_01290 [Alphaproteobacteria bacterium]|nr:hypothetical protein [Alphaproteobacteria bacterium]
MQRAIAVLLAALAAGAPAAQRPRLLPSRDVAITYRTERNGAVLEQRVHWSAAELRMRIDAPSPGLFVIVDYPAHRMEIVQMSDRTVVDMAAPTGAPWMTAGLADLDYARSGTDQVAGLPCAEWQARSRGQAEPTTICVTDDGVLLRVRQGPVVLAEARAVQYAPQDASLFRVPDGFTHVAPPR